jgi:hypothetical protein
VDYLQAERQGGRRWSILINDLSGELRARRIVPAGIIASREMIIGCFHRGILVTFVSHAGTNVNEAEYARLNHRSFLQDCPFHGMRNSIASRDAREINVDS